MKKYKRAIGYARVSTSEQRKLGNSLKNQVDNINNFCDRESILLMKIFQENASAANFERPKFIELLEYLKKYKGEIDVLLVDRHDRFSRDTESALTMTRKLNNLGVEVNFVSEWQEDVNSTDAKIIKTLRFTFAEVERQKIRQRTSMGQRASLSDGRYTKTPPLGFSLAKNSQGKTYIEPNEKAPLIKQLFYDYSLGLYTQKDLVKKYKEKGLKISKSQISRMLDNVLYKGYIDLKEHNIPPYSVIEAQHEAIVPYDIFEKVQLIKNGKTNQKGSTRTVNENFPLTSYIICDKCGNPFYGSNSNNGKKRKNTKYYKYYECKSDCKCEERYQAEIIHHEFNKLLKKIKPSEEIISLFKDVLIEEYKKSTSDRLLAIKDIENRLKQVHSDKISLTDKYISGKIEDDIYNTFCEKFKLEEIKLKQRKLDLGDFQSDIDKLLSFGVTMISNVDRLYNAASTKIKRQILSSNFSGKLTFSDGKFRTVELNEAILLMNRYNKGLKGSKKKKGTNSLISSQSVPKVGLEPTRPCEHRILNPTCLPIPPLWLIVSANL
ncbi:Site-specific recombinase [Tenacibaculum aestuarii]